MLAGHVRFHSGPWLIGILISLAVGNNCDHYVLDIV
jgi:hypothetical protein